MFLLHKMHFVITEMNWPLAKAKRERLDPCTLIITPTMVDLLAVLLPKIKSAPKFKKTKVIEDVVVCFIDKVSLCEEHLMIFFNWVL